ncbi:TolC family protein [Pandoraea terrigena]|uniref:Protein CyaE n=1 Tax=Pandoraea terrigena TaxID=2508292 RepID=A0A5E4YJE6_9BURK|nr:TolC family protein [Pandoraea terrigena]VVE48849.1 RND transporter [Pandoraea terrigena]
MRRLDPPTLIPVMAVTAVLTMTVLSGCATSSLDMAPERPDRPWQPDTDASGAIRPGASVLASQYHGTYRLPANPALATVSPPPPLAPDHAYTLPELIDLAQASNPTTRIAWNEARNAALTAGVAKSAYLPQLSLAAMGQYAAAHNSTSSVLGDSSASASTHGLTSVVALQWLLFDFGGRAARVEAASQATVMANIGFTAAHQQVVYDVSVAFYTYQAVRARVATAEQGLENARAVVDAAKSRYRRGIGTVIEVAQANQNYAQARLTLVQAQGAQRNTYLTLISAMGISPLSKPKIADMPVRALAPTLRQPVEQIVATAIARRPDVLSAYAAERANLAKIQAAESEFKPKVFLSASGVYNAGSSSLSAVPAIGQQLPTVNLSGGRYGGSVVIGVSIPIYDGGLRSAALARARNDADSASTRLERSREEAVRQIVGAQNILQNSLTANEAAKALLTAAQTTYDAAFDAYKHGVGSVTDALLAQNQLLVAKNAYADSYSNALSAAAALALATGAID